MKYMECQTNNQHHLLLCLNQTKIWLEGKKNHHQVSPA